MTAEAKPGGKPGTPDEGSAPSRVIKLFPVPAPRLPSEASAPSGQRPADQRAYEQVGQRARSGRPSGRAAGLGYPAGSQQWSRTQARVTSVTVTRARARMPQTQNPPLRLTRRGRVVLSGLAVVVILAVIAAVALSLASGVQASDHGGRSGSPYQGMHQVVVQPGQTLWSVAATAEPHADPRVVIQQIVSANALSGSTVQAGQLLWVPKA